MSDETTPLDATFSYFGSKHAIAHLYRAPKYSTIIEPFGGALGFSHKHHVGRDVLFAEKNPVLIALWDWVLSNRDTPERFLELPDFSDDMDWDALDEGARYLIGFLLRKVQTRPARRPSDWSEWNHETRLKLARQVPQMRRWRRVGTDYRELPNIEASWFID